MTELHQRNDGTWHLHGADVHDTCEVLDQYRKNDLDEFEQFLMDWTAFQARRTAQARMTPPKLIWNHNYTKLIEPDLTFIPYDQLPQPRGADGLFPDERIARHSASHRKAA